MTDRLNPPRRRVVMSGSLGPRTREELEDEHGQVWDARELAKDFVLTAIIGLQVVVRRLADDAVGHLSYQNQPRFYYGFVPAATYG